MSSENIDKKSILQKELNAKETLLVLVSVILMIVYGTIFIYPKYLEYKSYANNLEQIENEIINLKGKINELPNLESKLESLINELNVKNGVLSHNMEDGMFLIGLSKLIDSVNVELVDYSIEDTKQYDTFYAIPTNIELRGNYKNIREVMHYLEQQKNITQILDYKMETYIEESNEQANNSIETSIVSDSKVYWTVSGKSYHKENCPILLSEAQEFKNTVLSGNSRQSEKSSPCIECKPYYIENANKEIDTRPKAIGDVMAKFRFVMYSSKDPKVELRNDDFNAWKPGKWNPFTTTTR